MKMQIAVSSWQIRTLKIIHYLQNFPFKANLSTMMRIVSQKIGWNKGKHKGNKLAIANRTKLFPYHCALKFLDRYLDYRMHTKDP